MLHLCFPEFSSPVWVNHVAECSVTLACASMDVGSVPSMCARLLGASMLVLLQFFAAFEVAFLRLHY